MVIFNLFLKKKEEYDIEMNTLHWYVFCFFDTELRSILLYYVCFYSCFRYYIYAPHLKMQYIVKSKN